MSQIERGATIIDVIPYLSIATVCDDGTPWNTAVYAAFDDDLNFYWKSWVENIHSRNVIARPDVFIIIYDSRVPAGEGEGVFIKAQARALMEEDASEIEKACGVYALRTGGESSGGYTKFLHGQPRRIFKATPTQMWMNDGDTKNGDYVDVRHGLDMVAIKDFLKTMR